MTAFRFLPDTLQSLGSLISLPIRGAQLRRSSGFVKLSTIDRGLELETEICSRFNSEPFPFEICVLEFSNDSVLTSSGHFAISRIFDFPPIPRSSTSSQFRFCESLDNRPQPGIGKGNK
ncbi:hypothetical protein CDAR_205651 [Caerostris darwini]|uniref:Uncharacterized protein n=1 Tax=Caerostris darwini TaxID=1538125 RepID=A0AAV4WTP4_9ARAC|nr:hypothetical protein CDAR_205651 [Caerostris darwini]